MEFLIRVSSFDVLGLAVFLHIVPLKAPDNQPLTALCGSKTSSEV